MKKILIIGMDGLQMSQINKLNMPNLLKFQNQGFSFKNHHSSFPTVTRTNVASIVSGVNPGTHGILGNNMVFREYNKNKVLPVMYPEMKKIHETGKNIVLTPTLSEIAESNNLSLMVLNSGTSGNALIQNLGVLNNKNITFHRDIPVQDNQINTKWPKQDIPDINSNNHIIEIIENLDSNDLSDISIIWLDEPDKSQHNCGIDSNESITALENNDKIFKKILDIIDQNQFTPYIFLVSDHGYSKIKKTIDIRRELACDFPGYLFAENGGSFLVYSKENKIFDPILINEIISKSWAGVIITGNNKINYNGIHNYDLLYSSGIRNPDLFVSMNWNKSDESENTKSELFSTNLQKDKGNHGSISPLEINCSLIINGPGIKNGDKTFLPSGNIDILPTILHLLNIKIPTYIEGRVLTEIFERCENNDYDILKLPLTTKTPSGEYMQELQISLYKNYKYLDYGYVEK